MHTASWQEQNSTSLMMNKRNFSVNTGLLATMVCLLVCSAFTNQGGCNRKRSGLGNEMESLPATSQLQSNKLQERSVSAFKDKHNSIYTSMNGNSQSQQMGGLDFSGNLYWERDKLIWMSLKKFGFEGMRVLITPDSVIVLNRLEKTVMIKEAAWLESKYGIVDGFSMIQAMLLNQPRYLPKAEKTAAIKDSMHLLTQREGYRALDYFFTEGDYRLQKVELKELRQQINVSCVFKNWAEPGAQSFASRLREWDFYSPTDGAMSLSLKFDHVEFDQKRAVKFEIPAHYERI
jgi:hypothetical protein